MIDLSLALHRDLDLRGSRYVVPKWYRSSYGQPGNHRDAAQWRLHVALIHNLVLEFARAINLLIQRLQQADARVLAGAGRVVTGTGPAHAPMGAPEYSEVEAQDAEPYPGLSAFPQVIGTRAVGGLGVDSAAMPRAVAELENWIEQLVEQHGAGSGPPPLGTPPFSLARVQSEASATGGRLPGALVAAYGVLIFFAAVGGVLVAPWLLGAAIGGACAAAALHRQVWRWPPARSASLLVLLVSVIGAVAAERVGRGRGPSGTTTAPRQGVTSFPGQIVSGNHNLTIADLTSRSNFQTDQRASACHRLQYRVRIYNPGPSSVSDLRVAAGINTITPYRHIAPTVTASASDAQNGSVAFQASIKLPTPQTQAYVAGSTQILNSAGHVVKSSRAGALADGITATGRGIDIGTVDVGVTEYVEFQTMLSCLH